ncbi:MAG: cobalt-precorrin-6A reductase [Pseudomonadota bacterium]
MTRVLLLGGTTEASDLAKALADQGIDAVFSYAGRTEAPVRQPLPQRTGGFGGVAGLVDYLRQNAMTHLIDATHPFAAQMSHHAVQAASQTQTPLVAFERAPWQAAQGDQWQHAPDMAGAVAALPDDPARVFLAIGRQHLEDFAAKPQHHYLLRLVDHPAALPLRNATALIARGPFTLQGDLDLLQTHRITHIVAKNAGGSGARAKLDAARALSLPVILIERPSVPDRPRVDSVAQVLAWLHRANLGV